MPLFGHSKRDGQDAADGSAAAASAPPDFDELLRHFSDLPLAQRAAEVLTGISTQLKHGERSPMDTLLSFWLGDQYTAADRPESWYTLKYLLAEAFQALELARMVFRIDETPREPTTNYYAAIPAFHDGGPDGGLGPAVGPGPSPA